MPQLAFFYSPQVPQHPQTYAQKKVTASNPNHYLFGAELSSSANYYIMDPFNKRQRRKAAGNLVSGLFGGGTVPGGNALEQQPHKKPSTAQPRPSIHIPPRGIGPVYDPNENDVLSGRGGRINAHAGNVQFRAIVAMRKKEYLAKTTKKLQKAHIAADIVKQIRNMQPPGRFLKEDPDGAWFDIGDQKAIKKVGQALREDAPDIRTDLNEGEDDNASDPNISSGDDDDEDKSPSNKKATTPKGQSVVVSDVGNAITSSASGGGPAVAVSARGAKSGGINPTNINSAAATSRKHSYEPLAVIQDIPIAPTNDNHTITASTAQQYYQHPIMPTSKPSFGTKKSSSGGGGGGASVSGAAAAALMNEMQDEPPPFAYDTAFGRPFHPPPPSAIAGGGTSGSMISGISGLTDPMSALSSEMGLMPPPPPQQQQLQQQALQYQQQNALRSSQLQHLRQLWLNQQQQQQQRDQPHEELGVAMPMSHLPQHQEESSSHPQLATRQYSGSFSMASSSLQRSQSWHDIYGGTGKDDFNEVMSWTEHSLMGGGIGNRGDAASMASGNSASYHLHQQLPARTTNYRSNSNSNMSSNYHHYPLDSGMSTTSMSLLSGMGSLPSIMSDISENLMALDLAEPKMTNFFQ